MTLKEATKHADLNWLESEKSLANKNHIRVIQIARPILVFLSNFFIIPRKIRTILSHLVEVMDVFSNDAQSPLS